MCWNEDISLNTFLFGCFALIFIYFANTYTRYKSEAYARPIAYVGTFLFVSMQLLEYFIWKNIKNSKRNTLLSKLGLLLIVSQLYFLILFAQPIYYSLLLAIYTLFFLSIYLYKSMYNPFVFKTKVSPNGHLSWEWLRFDGKERPILWTGLILYLVPWLLAKRTPYTTLFIGGTLFMIGFVLLQKENTYGSMWCWLINVILLFTMMDILLVQPFREYNGLC